MGVLGSTHGSTTEYPSEYYGVPIGVLRSTHWSTTEYPWEYYPAAALERSSCLLFRASLDDGGALRTHGGTLSTHMGYFE
jgi:hypothetical protein